MDGMVRNIAFIILSPVLEGCLLKTSPDNLWGWNIAPQASPRLPVEYLTAACTLSGPDNCGFGLLCLEPACR